MRGNSVRTPPGIEYGPIAHAGGQRKSRREAEDVIDDPVGAEDCRPLVRIRTIPCLHVQREKRDPLVRLPVYMRKSVKGVRGEIGGHGYLDGLPAVPNLDVRRPLGEGRRRLGEYLRLWRGSSGLRIATA